MGQPIPGGPASSAATRRTTSSGCAARPGGAHARRRGAQRLWELLNSEDYINALGALTGNQAVQQVRAGLKAIYLSGWQVAADANLSGHTYPDQCLYPANSVPAVVRRINNALIRADQIDLGRRAATRAMTAALVRADRRRRRGRLRWRRSTRSS